MNVPIQRKMLLLTGMIFLGLFSTAYLVNSFTGNLFLPEAEINFDGDENAEAAAKEMDPENGYKIPGFYDEEFEYKEATMTEEEVLAIAEALEEVQEFRADHDNVSVWAWYDGYDYWYVDYFVNYWDKYYIEDNVVSTGEIAYEAEPVTDYSYYPEWNYLTVIIQDSTGNVFEIIQPVEPSLTEEEVYDIAVNSEEGIAFLEDYPDAEVYIWFDSFQYWYVEFYPLYEELEYKDTGLTDPDEAGYGYFWDYLSLVVDDLTGEIVEVYRPVEPSLTEEEVLEIAFSIPEIQELAEEYNDLEAWAYFDGFEYWYVDIYSYEHWEVWAYVTIDDSTAEVIDFYVPKLPDMTKDAIIAIAMEVSDVQNFLNKYDNSSIDAYFYSSWFYDETFDESGEKVSESEPGYTGETAAYWYVYVYSGIYLDAWGYLLISDDTGEIFESEFIMPELPTITYDEAITITQGHELTIAFLEDHSDDYGMYAYHFSDYYYDYDEKGDYGYSGEGSGVWYIVYYSPTEYDWWYLEGSKESPSYTEVGFRIDSETGEILDTWNYDWEEEIVPP
ncbi:MAG: hypothetical protein JSW11_04890 [Candidatus Heimdallarchaeota archaeon]|nr:MAG: hypothetical protein JSW11_04890 [Candidatus Heimdallarchaeota archaeon]